MINGGFQNQEFQSRRSETSTSGDRPSGERQEATEVSASCDSPKITINEDPALTPKKIAICKNKRTRTASSQRARTDGHMTDVINGPFPFLSDYCKSHSILDTLHNQMAGDVIVPCSCLMARTRILTVPCTVLPLLMVSESFLPSTTYDRDFFICFPAKPEVYSMVSGEQGQNIHV
ncbi:hypothetical protein J6590_032837 [Homalodisca vitripennis]|nr:hypothetical protein J6590_032837 [Homalodisca vitripennis]